MANVGWRAFADLGSKIASLALFVVMARQLGASQFGIFSYGLALVTIVTALGSFGQGTILIREVARDRSRAAEYFANTLALRALMSVPVVGLAVLLTALTGDRTTVVVVALLGAAFVAELQTFTCTAMYQAFERLSLVPVVIIGQRTFTALIGIAAMLAGGDVVAVAAIYLAGSVLAAVLAFWLLGRFVWRPRIEVRASRWRPLLAAAVPVGLASALATVILQTGTTVLGWLENDAEVGNYGAAQRLLQATFFIGWAVTAAVYPVFSRLGRESDPPVGFVYERAVKLGFALGLPLAVAAGLLAEPAVELLYGEEFEEAATALTLLAPVIAVYGINHVSMSLLVSQGRQLRAAAMYAAAAVVCVAGSAALIPAFSLEGAAVALTATEVLLALAFLTAARLETGARAWRRIGGPLVAGAAAAAAMLFLRSEPLAALLAGGAIYLTVLTAFEFAVFPEDARFFLHVARARRG